jgi:hypothetical protein
MNFENINTLTQIVLAVHTVLFYPVLRFAFILERRLTKIETRLDIGIKCDLAAIKK